MRHARTARSGTSPHLSLEDWLGTTRLVRHARTARSGIDKSTWELKGGTALSKASSSVRKSLTAQARKLGVLDVGLLTPEQGLALLELLKLAQGPFPHPLTLQDIMPIITKASASLPMFEVKSSSTAAETARKPASASIWQLSRLGANL